MYFYNFEHVQMDGVYRNHLVQIDGQGKKRKRRKEHLLKKKARKGGRKKGS